MVDGDLSALPKAKTLFTQMIFAGIFSHGSYDPRSSPLVVVNGTHSLPASKKSEAPCREKARLFGAYNAAASELAIALANLEDQIAVSSMAAYESLSRKTELVRIKWQGARLDLETHVFKHCCEGSIPTDYAALSAPVRQLRGTPHGS